MTDLSDWRGRHVILNIWASWCPPCVAEMPALERLHRRAGERVAVVSVSVDESRGAARPLVEQLGLTFPVLLDQGGERLASWGTVKYPETWIIDPDGVVVERIIGARDWDDPAWVARLGAGEH